MEEATGRESPLLVGPFDQSFGAFSPDSQWIAYASNESGRDEIYVQHYPGSGRKWSVSQDGGTRPRWTRGGAEIVFRSGNTMMCADVSTHPTLQIGVPKKLFEGDYAVDYDVSADGKRFVMLREPSRKTSTQLEVVTDATSEIARRVTAAERRE